MLSFFLVFSIINETWMDNQKCCLALYSSTNHLNHIMSYLWRGRKTKDTDKYPVTNYVKSYLRGGRMTKDTDRYPVPKFC